MAPHEFWYGSEFARSCVKKQQKQRCSLTKTSTTTETREPRKPGGACNFSDTKRTALRRIRLNTYLQV